MKTTIELADGLLRELKRVAEERGTTLRALLEEGARLVIERRPPKQRFRLRDASVDGAGLQAGIREGDWEQQRGMIYGERGADGDRVVAKKLKK